MSEDKRIREVPPVPSRPDPIEERGIVNDVVVPIVASGVGGAVGAHVTNLIHNQPSDPPPPDPPSIELPPGVDRD